MQILAVFLQPYKISFIILALRILKQKEDTILPVF